MPAPAESSECRLLQAGRAAAAGEQPLAVDGGAKCSRRPALGLDRFRLMGEGAAERQREPTWLRVCHAIITHGDANLSNRELYELVEGRKQGKPLSERAGENILKDLAVRGDFVRTQPARFGAGAGLVVAVSLGNESMRAAIVDANGAIPERVTSVGELPMWAHPTLHAVETHAAKQLSQSMPVLLDRVVWAAHEVARCALADMTLCRDGKLPLLGVVVAWPSALHRLSKTPTGTTLTDPAWRQGRRTNVAHRVA